MVPPRRRKRRENDFRSVKRVKQDRRNHQDCRDAAPEPYFRPGGAVEILNMQFQENQCDDDRQRPADRQDHISVDRADQCIAGIKEKLFQQP